MIDAFKEEISQVRKDKDAEIARLVSKSSASPNKSG